jgi:hypothetical protein
MSSSQLRQISFDEDTGFCRRCRLLDLEFIPIKGVEFLLDLRSRWDEESILQFYEACGRCRLLVRAMKSLGQKASFSILATDALRLHVRETSPFNSAGSWIEFYRLQVEGRRNLSVSQLVAIGF